MTTAKVLCDCGAFYSARATTTMEAVEEANQKRTACRRSDPELHQQLRNYTPIRTLVNMTEKASV